MRPPKKITAGYLERVALHYVERHGGSEGQLRRILAKRIRRSVEAFGEPSPEIIEEMVDELIAKLIRLGYVNDERVARTRARSLRRRGKSARAIRSTLFRLGIDAAIIDDAIEGDDLEAARTYVRRRRLSGGQKDLAKLARAGFSYDVAKRVLEEE